MLLRRLSKHVEDQNWLAVGLDFLIVVLGVFIGIQLGNWNDSRADKREYKLAVERYIAEAETNLDILNSLDAEFAGTLNQVSAALDALQSCEETPENRETLETGLTRIMGTSGLALHRNALDELNSSPALLAQQSQETRRRFSDTKFRLDLYLREAAYIEIIPLEERAQNNPLIDIGELTDRKTVYFGADYSRPTRTIHLKVPISEACKDDMLIKSIYTWERWQGTLPTVIGILRTDLEQNLAALEAS